MSLGKPVIGSSGRKKFGAVAQRLEQGTHNPLVGGSNPSSPIKGVKYVRETFLIFKCRPYCWGNGSSHLLLVTLIVGGSVNILRQIEVDDIYAGTFQLIKKNNGYWWSFLFSDEMYPLLRLKNRKCFDHNFVKNPIQICILIEFKEEDLS